MMLVWGPISIRRRILDSVLDRMTMYDLIKFRFEVYHIGSRMTWDPRMVRGIQP